VLLTRDFRLVWWGQLVSQIGDGVSKLALVWYVYAVTGSPLKTTVIGLLQTVPPILFGPLIGVLVDRSPKKALLIGSDVLRAILIGLIPCMISPERFTVDFLYVLVLCHAVVTAVFGPALIASVPFVVPRQKLTAANALLQSTTSLGIMLGPVLSGVGIAMLNSQSVLCVNAATYVISAVCLIPVRFRDEGSRRLAAAASRSPVEDLIAGLRFALIQQRTVLLLIVTAACYTFGSSALTTLFPVFGRKMLDLGPVEVGYLWSMLGLGLLVMSLLLVRVTDYGQGKRVRIIAATSAVTGLAIWGLVFVRQQSIAAILMAIVGGGMGAMTPIAWGLLQELSPREAIGRVLAIYNTGAMTAAIAGISAFGWITEKFGEPAGVFGIGSVMLLTSAVAGGVSQRLASHRSAPA
jgi:DHA3 family macrolide efflux protein-like MFS transporter